MKINLSFLSKYPFPIRIAVFLTSLIVLWLPYAGLIYFFITDKNQQTILTMVPLALGFFILIPLWAKSVHSKLRIYKHYGLEFTFRSWRELLQGTAIGITSILFLFSLQAILGWIVWNNPSTSLLKTVLEGALTGFGVAFAEEVVFRGWIVDELERDYRNQTVVWTAAIIFAISHFIKPWEEIIATSPQFLGLLLLGLTCVWAKYSCNGRLSLAIGIHGGLVWGYYIVNVGNLITYTRNVPIWFTGVNDNPLAGIAGLMCLIIITIWMKIRASKKIPIAHQD